MILFNVFFYVHVGILYDQKLFKNFMFIVLSRMLQVYRAFMSIGLMSCSIVLDKWLKIGSEVSLMFH